MIPILKKTFAMLEKRYRLQLLPMLLMMLLIASLETLGIGLLAPYIAVVNSPEMIIHSHYLGMVYRAFDFSSPERFIVSASLLLIVVFVLKNIAFVMQQYVQSRQLLSLQINIESRLMRSYLMREYLFFTQRNSSELYSNIRNVSGIIGLVLGPVLTIITELIVVALISILLFIVQPWVTLIVVVVSGGLGFGINRLTRSRAKRYGDEATGHMVEMNKWIFQSFGGIKEVKILSKESFFLDRSISLSRQSNWATMKAAMLAAMTRPVIETVWFCLTVLLVLISILLSKNGTSMLPIIVLLAAAAIRIMPALNRVLNAILSIRQAGIHVDSVADELLLPDGKAREQTREESQPEKMEFLQGIRFSDIGFEYPGGAGAVLHNLSFNIGKGQSVGFVGSSGAGKTTVVDMLLGLLEPQEGQILVDDVPLMPIDGRAWRANFGYVPQTIYLSDDSIRNNIAFGLHPAEIDEARLQVVVAQAQLTDVISRLPDGLDTVVGDRGARLSGGQRQRIGIARALYRDPPILVLDEATSALDNETEREISQAIHKLSGSKTIVLIAHRLSTVAECDLVVFLANGMVHAMGAYDELLRDCEEFRRFADAGAEEPDRKPIPNPSNV